MGTMIFINQETRIKTTAFECEGCGKDVKIESDIDIPIENKLCFSCLEKQYEAAG